MASTEKTESTAIIVSANNGHNNRRTTTNAQNIRSVWLRKVNIAVMRVIARVGETNISGSGFYTTQTSLIPTTSKSAFFIPIVSLVGFRSLGCAIFRIYIDKYVDISVNTIAIQTPKVRPTLTAIAIITIRENLVNYKNNDLIVRLVMSAPNASDFRRSLHSLQSLTKRES